MTFCSASCTVEDGWHCEGSPSVCTRTCGNNVVGDGEQCDDGNGVYGDGCTYSCTVEQYWECDTVNGRSECKPICGDDHEVKDVEQCDLGAGINGTPGSLCSANCETIIL